VRNSRTPRGAAAALSIPTAKVNVPLVCPAWSSGTRSVAQVKLR
jgi:hypothetical protein